ncbi:hypothetical protein ACFXC8_29805 [Streptomyces sp. NPDC059441]|uniref:hypothetical protein n=1 Tax=unclassified Streptomyces TaxID=2593676 RepID=UPI002250CB66|nr:hypothetical protein [Streptomyces sp. NBC_00365]MCX5097448.1 hypothetical protein [Streptomyces sp. NBC_00365]
MLLVPGERFGECPQDFHAGLRERRASMGESGAIAVCVDADGGRQGAGRQRVGTSQACGDLRDDDLEDLFIEIIIDDIGEGTDGWEFSGSSYSVELR